MAKLASPCQENLARWWPSSEACSGNVCGRHLWTIGFVTPPEADGLRAANHTGLYALQRDLRSASRKLDDGRYYIELTGTAEQLQRFIKWAGEYQHELCLAVRFKNAPFAASRVLS